MMNFTCVSSSTCHTVYSTRRTVHNRDSVSFFNSLFSYIIQITAIGSGKPISICAPFSRLFVYLFIFVLCILCWVVLFTATVIYFDKSYYIIAFEITYTITHSFTHTDIISSIMYARCISLLVYFARHAHWSIMWLWLSFYLFI